MTEEAPRKRILIVDDSETDRLFVAEYLEVDYDLYLAADGMEAIQIASEKVPDLILLDVSMPGMDGHQICTLIKNDPQLQNVDVIFISAHDSIEEKLKGYQVGASDYLVKPVDPDELFSKVKINLENSQLRLSISKQKLAALNAAEAAKAEASEQAVVIGFLRNCFSSPAVIDLANLVADTIGRFGLSNNVQIHAPWEVVNSSNCEPIPPLEKELLFRLHDTGRMHDLGKRLILNYSAISILIKNMPEDKDRADRLRDHVALILEAAESHCKKLFMDEDLRKLMVDSNESLLKVQSVQAAQRQTNINIIDKLMEDVEHAFVSFALTDEQEDTLYNIIKKAVDDSLDNYEEGLRIDEDLRELIDRLTSVLTPDPEPNDFLF